MHSEVLDEPSISAKSDHFDPAGPSSSGKVLYSLRPNKKCQCFSSSEAAAMARPDKAYLKQCTIPGYQCYMPLFAATHLKVVPNGIAIKKHRHWVL
jgi:hypothetical protein